MASGSQVNTTGLRTFAAGEVLAIYRRVKLTALNTVVYAGADDIEDGITAAAAAAIGDNVSVKLRNHPGTRKLTAAGAIAAGSYVKGMASGKVDDASTGGPTRWKAIEAASGNNSVFEALACDESGVRLAFSNAAESSAAGASSTAESFFDVTKTLDAASFEAGTEIDIEALVYYPGASNSTETGLVKLYFGGILLATTVATDFAANDIALVTAKVTVTTAGASGFAKAHGTFSTQAASGTAAPKTFRVAPTSQDLSGNVVVRGSVTMSGSNAANTAKLETLSVRVTKK